MPKKGDKHKNGKKIYCDKCEGYIQMEIGESKGNKPDFYYCSEHKKETGYARYYLAPVTGKHKKEESESEDESHRMKKKKKTAKDEDDKEDQSPEIKTNWLEEISVDLKELINLIQERLKAPTADTNLSSNH